jgi:Lrp/AsnC family transcriptional regulator, regulator for asnA, asnC and gidA
MDERDIEILKALVKNGRASYVELSKKLKITEAAVRKRVKKLEAKGTVKGFTTIIDPASLGFHAVAVIGIDTQSDALTNTFELVKSVKGVKYVALSSGDHMIIFEVWCKDQNELSQVISKVKKMEGVTKVCPAILLKSRELVG